MAVSTPPPTPRQEELLDLALDLAREGGLAGLTVRRLAERAGFTEAALYRHYASKEDLLLAMIDRIEARVLPTLREVLEDEERPVADRLRDLVRLHARAVLAIDGLPVLLVAEASSSEHAVLRERMRAMLSRYLGLLEELVRELPESATRPGPPETALMLFGLSAALAIHVRLFDDEELETGAADHLARYLVDCVARGGGEEKDEEVPS